MPLGSNVSENISELHRGPRYKKNVRKFGKAKANKIAIAAAYSGARRSGGKRKKKMTAREDYESYLRRSVTA